MGQTTVCVWCFSSFFCTSARFQSTDSAGAACLGSCSPCSCHDFARCTLLVAFWYLAPSYISILVAYSYSEKALARIPFAPPTCLSPTLFSAFPVFHRLDTPLVHHSTTAPQPPIIIIVSFSLGQSLAVPLLGIIKSNQPQNKASKKKKERRSTRLWALFLSFLKSTCRNTE